MPGQVGVTPSQWGAVLPGLPTHNLNKHIGIVVRPEASEQITQGSSHTRNVFFPPAKIPLGMGQKLTQSRKEEGRRRTPLSASRRPAKHSDRGKVVGGGEEEEEKGKDHFHKHLRSLSSALSPCGGRSKGIIPSVFATTPQSILPI